jgi:hypothetical protein
VTRNINKGNIMTTPKITIGNCYARKNDNGRIVAINVVTAIKEKDRQGMVGTYPWVDCEVWTIEGLVANTSFPIHFFDDTEDFLLCDREQALSLLVPITPTVISIKSTTPEWPKLLSEALNNGQTISTDSQNIRELAHLAAARMGVSVSINFND